MSDAIGISEISLSNSLKTMELISHNISNTNVSGYKRERPVMNGSLVSFGHMVENNSRQMVNHAAPTMSTVTDFSQGALMVTENSLNVGIEGDAFFMVQTPNGVAYSRSGNFQLDTQGRLSLNGQYPVLGESGEIILTNPNPKITPKGEVYDGDTFVDRFRLGFKSESNQLMKVGETLFVSQDSLDETSLKPFNLRQGYLESSNIQQADEMVLMMKINRQVEMTQRIIRGYDEMISEAVSTIADF